MAGKASYTVESLERALDVHRGANRIRSWRRVPPRGGRGQWVNWQIDHHAHGDQVVLRNPRELYLFTLALSSAAQAPAGALLDHGAADCGRCGEKHHPAGDCDADYAERAGLTLAQYRARLGFSATRLAG